MANINNAYIISYFGDNNIRNKRKIYHLKQLAWLKQQGLTPIVLPIDYNTDDYTDGIKYLPSVTKMLPGMARNICLQHFYSSNEDFAIFADNDCVLYDGAKYCDSSNFINIFNNLQIHDLIDIDFFYPLNPGRMPFTKMYNEQKTLFDQYIRFSRHLEPKSMYFIKNINKHHNKRIYFDTDNFVLHNGHLIAHEDTDFAIQFLLNGLSVYQCNNIVLKEFGSSTSTWLNQKDINRKISANIGREILCKKYNLLRKNNRMNYKPIYKLSQKSSKIDLHKRLDIQ
jgi:hypothetical protein